VAPAAFASSIRLPLAILTAIGAVATQVACDVSVKNGSISAEILTGQATREWTREYPLVPGGHVEIVNVNGPIDVAGVAADKVNVRATITAKAFTESHARVVLERGRIEEEATSERIKVTNIPPRAARGQSYTVRYELRVPTHAQIEIVSLNGALTVKGVGGGLKASVNNGTIEMQDISAPIEASAINGQVIAKLGKVAGNVRLETNNGRITLDIPASTKANLSARTVNGGINISGLPIEAPENRRQRRFDAILNGGGTDIELRTTNGRISITGTPDAP
jgi:DUF4097 and DUF4098 domain-containing protein YvlB